MTMKQFGRLVGSWRTEATHPAMPGVVVKGTAVVEWLEGEQFLITRSRTDHPDFPDAMTVIGNIERDRVNGDAKFEAKTSMHYYDSRGVFRDYDVSIDDVAWRWSRMAPGFSQRFTGTFADNGNTIVGVSQICQDDVTWKDDLKITFKRA